MSLLLKSVFSSIYHFSLSLFNKQSVLIIFFLHFCSFFHIFYCFFYHLSIFCVMHRYQAIFASWGSQRYQNLWVSPQNTVEVIKSIPQKSTCLHRFIRMPCLSYQFSVFYFCYFFFQLFFFVAHSHSHH